MKYVGILFLPTISCVYIYSLNRNQQFSTSYFMEKTGFFNSNSNPIKVVSNKSKITCGIVCIETIQCWHAIYEKDTKQCKLYRKYNEFKNSPSNKFGYLLSSPKEGIEISRAPQCSQCPDDTICQILSKSIHCSRMCPTNWQNLYGNHCYYVSSHSGKFHDVLNNCSNYHAYLISYETKDEFDAVAKKLPSKTYYIGLIYNSSLDEHRWLSTGEVASWTKWNPGNPGNPQPQKNMGEDCTLQGSSYYNQRSWYDDYCMSSERFICEMGIF
ncbi:DgyrCDS10764 [Dimorphilus gyrociliatus]|uniref:DgyrCDS10764 n=1 Tax=Dimorphilus gyrociliatus TaxID=2664684 RepID=A0A7I8W188_9ANNE|nr:DgyrCDS10764 [Dimorphilus gyrociliatus]